MGKLWKECLSSRIWQASLVKLAELTRTKQLGSEKRNRHSQCLCLFGKKLYQIANEVQDIQYNREFCPSVWFGNMEIDETTGQEIANLYQQVFKEDPEHPLARGHFK